MQKLREMVDVNTIVGQPIVTPDGVTIIPVSKLTFGYGAGGGEYQGTTTPNFGGGGGAGVTIHPVAFLVVQGERVQLLPVNKPAGTSIDRLIDAVPETLEKINAMIEAHKKEKSGE
jgi:sporulation protein YtfJ